MDETDFSMGHVIETPHSPNDETDARTGRVRYTPHPTYDQTDFRQNLHLAFNREYPTTDR